MKSNLFKIAFAAQSLLLLAMLFGPHYLDTPAQAQVPDSGAQRLQIIQELRTLNGKMDTLNAKLNEGIKVQVPETK